MYNVFITRRLLKDATQENHMYLIELNSSDIPLSQRSTNIIRRANLNENRKKSTDFGKQKLDTQRPEIQNSVRNFTLDEAIKCIDR